MERAEFSVDNGDGWTLDIKRYWRPDRLRPARPALLFIPGYCMNTFILAFHPTGRSLVEFLADDGYDVWTANLRGQGDSIHQGGDRTVSFAAWCDADVPAAIAFVQARSPGLQRKVVLIGCSLGGTVVYGVLARQRYTDRIIAAITIGAPLRWPRLARWARPFVWPAAVGRVRIRGTRTVARTLLPIARRVPSALSIYMSPDHIQLDRADVLTQTVDDPEPGINEALVRWLKDGDLWIGQTNITEQLRWARLPILAAFGNADGIVPTRVARRVAEFAAAGTVTLLEVGDEQIPFAHADMFISDHAEDRVFIPVARWLSNLDGHRGR